MYILSIVEVLSIYIDLHIFIHNTYFMEMILGVFVFISVLIMCIICKLSQLPFFM